MEVRYDDLYVLSNEEFEAINKAYIEKKHEEMSLQNRLMQTIASFSMGAKQGADYSNLLGLKPIGVDKIKEKLQIKSNKKKFMNLHKNFMESYKKKKDGNRKKS